MSDKKSKFWPRIAYSCGTFGHDVFYAMLGTYFMIFVTSNLFHSDNHEHDAYMIGIVTTIILVLRVGDLFLDPFGNSMGALPTMINSGISVPDGQPGADRVWAAALTLVLIVMVLNLIARRIASRNRLK